MKKIIIILFLFLSCYKALAFFNSSNRELDLTVSAKTVTLNDNGLVFSSTTSAATVADFLKEKNIGLGEHDQITPSQDGPLFSGANLIIRRAVQISISADGQKNKFYSLATKVGDAILDSKINLGADDLVSPNIETTLKNNLEIAITRVDIKEETLQKPIAFDTQSTSDDSLGWRIKKVQQKGIPGIKEITYKVVSHDGKEISRKIINQNTTKDPTPEIVVQGTYMKLGKSKNGQGTWYAFKGGLFAASTTLPRGSFAKVTNADSGQSVVVQINDYGPFGKGRIIDLDKVAFQKIADLGSGVINVKVEQVLN